MTRPCAKAPSTARPSVSRAPGRHHAQNSQRLRAYARCSDPGERVRHRNALVCDNLRLVYRVAGRQAQVSRLSFEELVQVGSLGLLRAVEAFDGGRGRSLSTFAVPYIRGRMLQEQRDRQDLVRIPRPLWELRHRLTRLQDLRRRDGLRPLRGAGLARALGCSLQNLEAVQQINQVRTMASLDAPLADEDGQEHCLLDHLPAPEAADPALRPDDDDPQWQWLQRRLEQLAPQGRELVLGRVVQGLSWAALGTRLGLAPRRAQQCFEELMEQLRQEAALWSEGGGAVAA